jgi:hypothetical protein
LADPEAVLIGGGRRIVLQPDHCGNRRALCSPEDGARTGRPRTATLPFVRDRPTLPTKVARNGEPR